MVQCNDAHLIILQNVFEEQGQLTRSIINKVNLLKYYMFISVLWVLWVSQCLVRETLCGGVSLLGVDYTNSPIVERTLTAPALLLPPQRSRSHTAPAWPWPPVCWWLASRSLAAVVLLVVVSSELLAVVTAAHKASVAVSDSPMCPISAGLLNIRWVQFLYIRKFGKFDIRPGLWT